MANLSEYPDGITRLDAYRRLLAPEPRLTLTQRTIARWRAAWCVLRALWGRA